MQMERKETPVPQYLEVYIDELEKPSKLSQSL